MLPNQSRASDLLRRLLDNNYTRAAQVVTRAIVGNSESGVMARRLREMDAEARRLAEVGERMTADNPVVRALLADFETTMRANARLIDGASGQLQQMGIDAGREITFRLSTGLETPAQLTRLGISWNTPSTEAIARVVEYTDSSAWADLLAGYADGAVTAVQNIAVRGVVAGRGPLAIAREMRRAVEGIPAAQANNLMRTLQLTTYRESTAATTAANADILEPYSIRIAVLDARTCMACVVLHGTRIPVGQRIDDHNQGRCTSVTPIRGRTINVRSGIDWFEALSETRQRSQMHNDAMYEAWRTGAVRLTEIPRRRVDPVFGGQVIEASLVGLLGPAAAQFYQRNRQAG